MCIIWIQCGIRETRIVIQSINEKQVLGMSDSHCKILCNLRTLNGMKGEKYNSILINTW